MKRKLFYTITVILYFNISICFAQTAEMFVKEFYSLYLSYNKTSNDVLINDKIYKYISNNVISTLKQDRGDIDYFTKTGIYTLNMEDMTVKSVNNVGYNLSVAHVVFKTSMDNIDIILFLEKYNNTFLIIRVVDVYGY